VGFNARPIACSLKKAGAAVYVSDYWGDADLAACCDEQVAVLASDPGTRQRQPIGKPLHEALVDNMLLLAEDIPELDYVFFGSGFDDCPDSLEALRSVGELVGNSSQLIKMARDRKRIEKLLDGTPVQLPLSVKASQFSPSEMGIGFPVVFRPVVSGGGSGIRLMRNPEELERHLSGRESLSGFLVQEYISGFDVSCSLLSTGDKAQILSVQGQLIGMPSAGLNCTFTYCGNYIPVSLRKRLRDIIEETSAYLCEELQLVGSNGLDFVVDRGGQIFLMEINPRLQGSLEMLEASAGISVTAMHLDAASGHLPDKAIDFKPAVKMIVYARRSSTIKDLSAFPDAVDRSPNGVRVKRGDPVCTLLKTGPSVAECYREAMRDAWRIQSANVPADNQHDT
jgi:predicted ATP-grasp superfamily ATP-dependent carboligase